MLTREPDIANDITLQMNTANENCLSDLLPYDTASKTGIRLKDGLNEFLVLLTASEAAIEAFLNGNLHNFDPLVGENACQIRAIKIALIALDPPKDIPKYLQSFKRAKEKIEKFIQNVEDFSNIEMSLKSYLFNENVDFALSDDLFFLIKSFILTRTKIVLPFYKDNMPLVENAYTDSKKIKEIGKVGSSFSGELVKKARKRLSKSSAKFVQELAHNLDSSDSAKKYTTDQFAISHNGLKCLPYYWLTRVLMIKALNSAIPIVMIAQQIAKDQAYRKVENTIICFQVYPSGYKEVPSSEIPSDSPVIVLIGSTWKDFSQLANKVEWRKELLQQCPIDMVLAYAAAHRQYPDEVQERKIKSMVDTNYEYHKAKANEWGCSLENPSRFFLTHAFCDTMKNISLHVNI